MGQGDRFETTEKRLINYGTKSPYGRIKTLSSAFFIYDPYNTKYAAPLSPLKWGEKLGFEVIIQEVDIKNNLIMRRNKLSPQRVLQLKKGRVMLSPLNKRLVK